MQYNLVSDFQNSTTRDNLNTVHIINKAVLKRAYLLLHLWI